jgi:hypothetical protein
MFLVIRGLKPAAIQSRPLRGHLNTPYSSAYGTGRYVRNRVRGDPIRAGYLEAQSAQLARREVKDEQHAAWPSPHQAAAGHQHQ